MVKVDKRTDVRYNLNVNYREQKLWQSFLLGKKSLNCTKNGTNKAILYSHKTTKR